MQPPPRPGPPGVSRPPQASGGPNAFRRQRPHKNTGSMAGQPPPAQPMTDPFAFGRQNAPILAAPSSSPQPIQNMAPSTYPQAGMSQGLHQSQPLEDAQAGAAPLDPQLSSTPGVSLFTPHSGMSPFPGALLCPPDHASPSAEQGYFNSSVPVPSMTPRPPPMASAPVPGQAPHAPDHRGEPPPRVMPFPPVFAASSQWGHDHGSRPPSVQNYFQPTSDPLPMTYHTPAQIPSPHGAPPVQQTLPSPQQPDKAPSSQWSNLANANGLQQHDSHFQNQSYLSQSSASQESRLNQPPQDLAYHQMGAGPSLTRPDSAGSHYRPDSAGSHHGSAPAPVPYVADGTISMFFEGSDVENEETLAGEGGRTVNGLQPSHSHEQMSSHNPQAHLLAGVEAPQGYQAPPLEADQPPPYMFDNNFPGAEDTAQPKPTEGQFDHVENLECVTNQEVLPSEPQSSPVAAAAHGGVRYEVGPNLETPDCVSRPMRSASVSSSYSNMSHSSGTGIVPRRHQGVVGTFIQQESPRPSEDVHLAAASGGYFEQIDTSPAGDAAAARHRVSERVYPSQPPTPSPPKPTGVFQASANSSFEPVRSHTVGVRPVEVDRARMVVERGSDSLPGNLEQPPDNVENIYGAAVGHAQAGVGVPPLGYPLSQSLSRPSSRAHVAHRPCESPATTLWAQQDPASLGANILLAPAAPPVLAPLREPSAEVIQPPEDNPLDLQAPHHGSLPSPHPTENLENPPKVSEGDFSDPQTALGYASLLVSESLHQPVLIAPPISNYSVIPPSNSALSANQISPREASLPVRTPASQPSPRPSSHQNPLFPPTQMSFSSTSSQSPLNLAREGAPIHVSAAPAATNHDQQSNYELLDFSMHQSQIPNQAAGQPPPSLQQGPPLASNAPGFYLQVTKDAQHGAKGEGDSPVPGHLGQVEAPSAPLSGGPRSQGQYPPQVQVPARGNAPSAAYPVPGVPASNPPKSGTGPTPQGLPGAQPSPADPLQPPSSLGSQQGYGPPPPVPGYGGYYGGAYTEYPDGRALYPPAPFPPAPVDPRATILTVYFFPQDDPYRRLDPRYGRYDGANPAYPPYREPQPERPSSRTSQYSDRPSSRSGQSNNCNILMASNCLCPDRSRWDTYNVAAGAYDPRYRDYYDQNYWYSYHPEAYRGREAAYYNQQPAHLSGIRPQGYDDQWRYYPGYDASFDDDYRRQRDLYGDDFDRRSVHSEQSAHSLHSSHSHHSRHSSFSSRSQQSQVYRSQPDLTAVYDPTVSTLPVDYSYGQYPEQTDLGQSFSQYPYTSGYQADDSTWVATEQPPPRPVTPEKFSVPHRCACFGPGGHLIQVLPNLPSAGQPALVEIHNMEVTWEPNPQFARVQLSLIVDDTHKVDVIKFSQNKVLECARNNDLLDKDSAALLWDFIVLLCRQNGTVVGTDLADLLLKEHRSVWLPGKSPNEANLIDFNNEPLARAEEEPGAGPLSLLSDTFMTVPENVGKETERFRELLLFGRKKDALEAAMKGGLWGHALLLASKMDSRTHARVMTRFANSLPINDPLQTVYQLMSGRMPASATCCGDEKWGDWRPHLAMVLSNLTHTLDLDTRTITTMGDTLASKGLIDAAHFCYLMAQVGLGVFTKKSTKMVLIGSNHSLSFYQFATNEAIQRTEAYEYAQSLGSQPCSLPNFQVFKLIYACRLAEAGLCAQAFHYCEVISRSVLIQPSYHSPVFISQLIQMSEKMRFFDPQLKEKADQELFMEPEWLIHLRQLDGQMRTGVIAYNEDRATPQQYDCCTPSSELDQPSPPEPYAQPLSIDEHTSGNPLMTSLIPGPPPQGVQLMPPGEPTQPPGRRSRTTSESSTHSGGRERSNSAVKQTSPPPPSIPEQPHKEDMKKAKKDSPKKIVWDEKKQKWVNLDEPEEEYKPPPPPPSGFPKMPGPKAGPGGPPTGGPPVNMFSRRAGTKSRYVDVLNPGGTRAKPCGSAPAPSDFFAPLAPMPMPTNLFVPGAGIPSVCWRMCTCDQQPMEGNVPQTEGNQEQSGPNPSSVSQVPYYIPSILDYN
uniref:Protein transport protein Sec16A n=1 Tax=Esox lucius TaxID=8010 RepID=A0AAY5KIG5_ESOLU